MPLRADHRPRRPTRSWMRTCGARLVLRRWPGPIRPSTHCRSGRVLCATDQFGKMVKPGCDGDFLATRKATEQARSGQCLDGPGLLPTRLLRRFASRNEMLRHVLQFSHAGRSHHGSREPNVRYHSVSSQSAHDRLCEVFRRCCAAEVAGADLVQVQHLADDRMQVLRQVHTPHMLQHESGRQQ